MKQSITRAQFLDYLAELVHRIDQMIEVYPEIRLAYLPDCYYAQAKRCLNRKTNSTEQIDEAYAGAVFVYQVCVYQVKEIEAKRAGGEEVKTHQLSRDGKVIFEGTENECLMKLHRVQGQSWDYAMKYGGYAIKPIKPKGAAKK